MKQLSPIENSLSQWLQSSEQFAEGNSCHVRALSGDAGFRQYFSLPNQPQWLAVYAPPEHIDSQIFIDLSVYLRNEGIHAPRVLQYDLKRGFLLIENLGDTLFLSALTKDNVESLYGGALLTLLRLQQAPPQPPLIKPYNEAELRREMDLFPHWFVERLLGHALTRNEQELIQDLFKKSVQNAAAQPQVFVHRDYHSRNLIYREVGPPGVIDFQDAVWGPITYDLVSLLKDCYVRWPRARVNRWVRAYASMITSAGLVKSVSDNQFQQWFDWMGLQRHIKVLGIFARLFLRDNKSAYLHDLPLVIRYVMETFNDYREFDEHKSWFENTIIPLCQQQPWYHNYRKAGYSPDKSHLK